MCAMPSEEQTRLSIGELARRSGASVRSIRHYDAQGLLTSGRADNGYRVFPVAAVTQVRQIGRLIAAGFSLADIAAFPNCMLAVDGAAMCPETAPARRKLLAAIEAEMSALEHRRLRLRAMLVDGSMPAD
jgi:MerR family copper efflux transcriptional regulator